MEAFALRKDGAPRVVVADLGPEAQKVTVQGLGSGVRVGHLNEVNVQEAMVHPTAFRAGAATVVETKGGTLELSLLP